MMPRRLLRFGWTPRHNSHLGHCGRESHCGPHQHLNPPPMANLVSERCNGPAGYCGDGSVFHFGYTETILFGPWQIDSVGGLIGSMFAIAIFCALYEGLKHYRAHLSQRPSCKNVEPSMWNGMHLYQTFLHAIQIVVSNLIMLIFMTYNVWLCLAATLGGMLGFFFLGYKK